MQGKRQYYWFIAVTISRPPFEKVTDDQFLTRKQFIIIFSYPQIYAVSMDVYMLTPLHHRLHL